MLWFQSCQLTSDVTRDITRHYTGRYHGTLYGTLHGTLHRIFSSIRNYAIVAFIYWNQQPCVQLSLTQDFYERLTSYGGIHKIWGKVVYNSYLFALGQPYFSGKHQIA
jgi:hypothetical protein